MKTSDKFYITFFILLVIFSFFNVGLNRLRFDQILTTQSFLSEKINNPIPLRESETYSKRATIRVPNLSIRRGGFYTGSAFKVDKNLWITARHVINDCNAVFVSISNKKEKTNYELIKEVFIHPRSDMAAFYFSNSGDYFDVPNYADKDYRSFVRKKAFSIGYPGGNPGNIQLGYLGKASLKNEMYKIIEPIFVWNILDKMPNDLFSVGGISGGPLLNKNAKLIGVMVAEQLRRGTVSTADLQSINWIIKALEQNQKTKKINTTISIKNLRNLTDRFLENKNIVKVMCRT